MSQKLTYGFILISLLGCHGNPYAGMSDRLGPNRPDLSKMQPATESFSIVAPGHLSMIEGTSSSIFLSAKADGQVTALGVDHPPQWASFNMVTGELLLSPPIGTAADPSNPVALSTDYNIEVKLVTAGKPAVTLTQNILVTVYKAGVR